MIKSKTFILALHTMYIDAKKGKKFLVDRRISVAEKTILNCYLLQRDNQFQETIDILSKLVTVDTIVESQRQLLLGVAYNNLTKFVEAKPYLIESLNLMKEFNVSELKFKAYGNLFILALNFKNKFEMKEALDQMHIYRPDTQVAQIALKRASFNYYSFVGDEEKAKNLSKELEKLKPRMTETQIISFLVEKFMFLVKIEEFDQCEETLHEMKKYRKFQLTANYNYMKLLLEQYLYDKPIYMNDRDFIEYPFLFNQMKVIVMLESGDSEKANEYWQKLHHSYPLIFSSEFSNYLGDKCIFSLSLSKFKDSKNVSSIQKLELPEVKEAALLKILTEAKVPVPQPLIYELIWGEVAESKAELKKIAQLVYQLRIKSGINIKSKKNCYYIESEAKTKVS